MDLPSRHGSPAPVVIGARSGEDGAFDQIGTRTRALGVTRAWLVTDRGLGATPWIDRAVARLADAGVVVEVFGDVAPDPSDDDVVAAAVRARAFAPDGVVGIGGGSVLDTAKGVALLLANGGRMEDWWGFGKAPAPAVPVVAVPTTAGTGSEAQSFAVIRRSSDGQKMACGGTTLRPRLVLLDGRLTLTAPRQTTAYAALDAMGHALEAAVCSARTDDVTRSALLALAALWRSLPTVLDSPGDLPARSEMLRAAFLAGTCIEASMLGAAHACANALSAAHHVPHGAAVGLFLPRVVRHNTADPAAAAIYLRAAEAIGLSSVEALACALDELLVRLELPPLAGWGVGPAEPPALATVAARQWTGTFNPVQPVDWVGLLAV